MINNFSTNPNIMAVFNQALQLATFKDIKSAFIAQLQNSADFTSGQKTAIMLAAEKLAEFPNSDYNTFDGPLLGILKLNWQDIQVDAENTPALTDVQRVAIFDAVMDIAKAIINAESQRLSGIAALDTSLPVDWVTE